MNSAQNFGDASSANDILPKATVSVASGSGVSLSESFATTSGGATTSATAFGSAHAGAASACSPAGTRWSTGAAAAAGAGAGGARGSCASSSSPWTTHTDSSMSAPDTVPMDLCRRQQACDPNMLEGAINKALRDRVRLQECSFISRGLCHLCGSDDNQLVPVVNFCSRFMVTHSLCAAHIRSVYHLELDELVRKAQQVSQSQSQNGRPQQQLQAHDAQPIMVNGMAVGMKNNKVMLMCCVCSRVCPCEQCQKEKRREIDSYKQWLSRDASSCASAPAATSAPAHRANSAVMNMEDRSQDVDTDGRLPLETHRGAPPPLSIPLSARGSHSSDPESMDWDASLSTRSGHHPSPPSSLALSLSPDRSFQMQPEPSPQLSADPKGRNSSSRAPKRAAKSVQLDSMEGKPRHENHSQSQTQNQPRSEPKRVTEQVPMGSVATSQQTPPTCSRSGAVNPGIALTMAVTTANALGAAPVVGISQANTDVPPLNTQRVVATSYTTPESSPGKLGRGIRKQKRRREGISPSQSISPASSVGGEPKAKVAKTMTETRDNSGAMAPMPTDVPEKNQELPNHNADSTVSLATTETNDVNATRTSATVNSSSAGASPMSESGVTPITIAPSTISINTDAPVVNAEPELVATQAVAKAASRQNTPRHTTPRNTGLRQPTPRQMAARQVTPTVLPVAVNHPPTPKAAKSPKHGNDGSGRANKTLSAKKPATSMRKQAPKSRSNSSSPKPKRKGPEKTKPASLGASDRQRLEKENETFADNQKMTDDGENDDNDSDLDANLDYCEICMKAGDLLCCDFCPRSFHLGCLKVSEDDLPEGDWQCNECRKPQTYFRTYAANVAKKKTIPSKCLQIIKSLQVHPFAKPFLKPVENVPNYKSVVKKPMDLSTIVSNLNQSRYAIEGRKFNLHAFAEDVRLIWANCKLFNDDGSGIARAADELSKGFEKLYTQVLESTLEPMDESKSSAPKAVPLPPPNKPTATSESTTPSIPPDVSKSTRIHEAPTTQAVAQESSPAADRASTKSSEPSKASEENAGLKKSEAGSSTLEVNKPVEASANIEATNQQTNSSKPIAHTSADIASSGEDAGTVGPPSANGVDEVAGTGNGETSMDTSSNLDLKSMSAPTATESNTVTSADTSVDNNLAVDDSSTMLEEDADTHPIAKAIAIAITKASSAAKKQIDAASGASNSNTNPTSTSTTNVAANDNTNPVTNATVNTVPTSNADSIDRINAISNAEVDLSGSIITATISSADPLNADGVTPDAKDTTASFDLKETERTAEQPAPVNTVE